MGAVFRGEHLGNSHEVAIKILTADFAKNKKFAARFEREAEAAGRMSHPNCVAVSDFGKLPDGSLYLVMELVAGKSLSQTLADEGPIDLNRALAITRDVLSALSHAHKLNVIHRDVKPDNVLIVTEKGGVESAKLLDFGIAKLIGEELSSEHSALTVKGTTVGTPHYLSPEQALGKPVDGRADLYAVTAMLFELLTGVPPYDAVNPLNVLRMHVRGEIPKLASFVDFPVSESLQGLLEIGLAKTPEERFDSADAYFGAVSEVLAHSNLPLGTPRALASIKDDELLGEIQDHPITIPRYWPVALFVAVILVIVAAMA